jgi:ADP-ribose pyrophosphatase YjhB (NUDIX family)
MNNKVVAYITRKRDGNMELLVFTHRDFPEAGLQVPAGTVEEGEMPEQALWREVSEETGRAGFAFVRHIATYDYCDVLTQKTYLRHVYHLSAPADLPDCWQYGERYGTPEQITFEFFWVALQPLPVLSGGFGDYLHALSD